MIGLRRMRGLKGRRLLKRSLRLRGVIQYIYIDILRMYKFFVGSEILFGSLYLSAWYYEII